MNYVGFSKFDTANGPGVRVSLFVAGCTVHCKGCFNPESWDFRAGKPFTGEALEALLSGLRSPYVRGLSILGGDPFEKENMPQVLAIAQAVRREFGSTKDIWIWSGRTREVLERDSSARAILSEADVLVDGPFVEKLKVTEKGHWFGSTNQRVIRLRPVAAVPAAQDRAPR